MIKKLRGILSLMGFFCLVAFFTSSAVWRAIHSLGSIAVVWDAGQKRAVDMRWKEKEVCD